MTFEARIVDRRAKTFDPDFALPDMRVPVDLRAEVGFGVVEVKGDDLIEPDERIELVHCVVPTFGRADIVAGGEQMGGIEADGKAPGIADAIEDRGQVFESISQTASLAGSVFESDAHS